jgi:hypothetical protein
MKRKLTKKQIEQQAEFEKMMAKHAKPLERGARAKGAVVKTSAPSKMPKLLDAGRRNHRDLPSLDTGYSSTAAKEQPTYTGDKVLGVALMHKSSYAPVFDEQGAKEIARMRR